LKSATKVYLLKKYGENQMFDKIRKKMFGPSKEELEKIRAEEEKRQELLQSLRGLEKEYNAERENFSAMYARNLKYMIEEGYLIAELEDHAGWEKYGDSVANFPYIRWNDEMLKSIRAKAEEILKLKKQLFLVPQTLEITNPDFFEEEKLYREACEKQRQYYREKYNKDKFGFLELCELMYKEIFESIIKDETWRKVIDAMKNFAARLENFEEERLEKVNRLMQMVEEPPVVWLSLDEKYEYYTSQNDEKWDSILDYADAEYQGHEYFYLKEKAANKYVSSVINTFRNGEDKKLRDSYNFLVNGLIPVYREGLTFPYWADEKSPVYKAYTDVPTFRTVFSQFPYNMHMGKNIPSDMYCQGRLFLGTLFKKLCKYNDKFYYGLTHRDEVNKAIEVAKSLRPQFYNERKVVMLGVEGENWVKQELDKFDDMTINLYNIRLEYDGLSIETDSIIIAPSGIYSIEIKNFGSEGQYELEIAKDGQWRKVIREKNINEPISDVYLQAMNHVNGTRRVIKNKIAEKENSLLKDKEIFIQPVIVIANNQVIINNESDQAVLRPSNVYNYIFNINGGRAIYSRQEMEEIRDIILEAKLESNKYPITDYRKMVEAIKDVFEIDNDVYNQYLLLQHQIEQIVKEGNPECKPVSIYSWALAELWFAKTKSLQI